MEVNSRCATPVSIPAEAKENIEINSPGVISGKRSLKRVVASVPLSQDDFEKPQKYEKVPDFASSSSSCFDDRKGQLFGSITYASKKTVAAAGAQTVSGTGIFGSGIKKFPNLTLGNFINNEDAEKPLLSPQDLRNLEIEEVEGSVDHDALLERHGLKTGAQIGSGAFGSVYDVTSKEGGKNFIYKIQNLSKAKQLEKKREGNGMKLWRSSDFAASRLQNKLPQLARIVSYTILATTPKGARQRFYVPTDKIRSFAKNLPESTRVTIEGMLMERAPGKNLADLIKNGEITPSLADPHFRNILIGAHEFILAAHPHNFIHGDLKPQNIMYDMESGKVTIIDTGESLRLRSRGLKTVKQEPGPSNPKTTTKFEGTRHFIAPAIALAKEYGSEVDFFSVGMTILNLISKEEAGIFSKQRFVQPVLGDPLFQDQESTRFLDTYLTTVQASLRDGSQSLTEACFADQPKLQRMIDLDFQISAGGEGTEGALAELRQIVDELKTAVS